ncbi:MAG: ribosome small subunit-dependent GTPase A [Bacteriovoracaceae bacterium]
MIRARVYKSSKRQFECKIIETGEFVKAQALGNILKGKDTIVVGDYVQLKLDEQNKNYEIHEVEQRNNEIYRLSIREQKKKITASNVDYLVVVSSVTKPAFKQGIIDRFLVRAHQWQIVPLLIFNKMDQFNDELDVKFESDRLKSLGVDCFEVSSKDKDYEKKILELGIEDIKKKIKGKTALFLGQSGVGKSSLITAISGHTYELRTQEVNKSGKGSHTTTWSEIIDCGEFALLDSPGIRSFSIEDIMGEELISLFPDVEELAVQCQFRNCEHNENSKGCYFNKLDEDEYETKLIHSRLESFIRMKEEIDSRPDWDKKF